MMLNYDELLERHLLDKAENRELTLIKMMLEKKVESLTKMVVDRNASINILSDILSRMCGGESKDKVVGDRNTTIDNLNVRLVDATERQNRQYDIIKELQKNISILHTDAQEKEQELREKERVLSDRYDIIAKQIDKIVVLRDAIHCMQGEAREKDVALGEHYDTIMRQAGKLLKLQQQMAEIVEASKEWVYMYGTSSIMPKQTQELLNKLKEIFTYDRYHINEETNEWVSDCEKRTCYDDSQGQTPPGYGSTEPTQKTPGSPKQSYDYRKVGL